MKRKFFLIALMLLAFPLTGSAEWFRRNTHTHTNISDGNSTPGTVVTWYKNHSYQFLVITDHNSG